VHCLKLSPNLRYTLSRTGKNDFDAAKLATIIDIALKSDVSDVDEGCKLLVTNGSQE
jgi:hypothetical protein